MQDLIAWKNREDRKPLILLGARQVGKTYILKEFGRREFENIAYINCDNNAMVKDLFLTDYNVERILLTIGAITGVNIQAGKTLIVMPSVNENVIRSAHNIPGVKTALTNTLNVYDILNHDYFVVTKEAVEKIEEVYSK